MSWKNDATSDLPNLRYDYLPWIVENTDRWNLTKTSNGYTLSDKTSPQIDTLSFTGADAAKLEDLLTKSWTTNPEMSLNRRFAKIWAHFVRRLHEL